jgi:hypothetical protein
MSLSPRAWWSTLVRMTVAVRALEPGRVQAEVRRIGGQRRWLMPLAYAAGTVAIVFEGIVLLLRNWRLLFLMLVPALWISLMSWNLRSRVFSHRDLPTAEAPAIAVGVLVVSLIAYWCNATFAFTLTQDRGVHIRAAFAQARPHWRLVSGLALATGVAQGAVWIWVADLGLRWFSLALAAMLVVQIYLFVAVPSWLIGTRPRESRHERILRTLTTGALSGVAVAPGFLLNRIGLLLLSVPGIRFIGIILVGAGAALWVAASSSVRVVKMAARLRGGGEEKAASAPAVSALDLERPSSTGAEP